MTRTHNSQFVRLQVKYILVIEVAFSSFLQIEYAIEEKASQMIETIQKQEAELLRELRQNADKKLEVLEEELDIVDFYIAKAHSLQVIHIMWPHLRNVEKCDVKLIHYIYNT